MKIKTTKLLLKILVLSSASFFYGAVNSQTRSPWEMDNRGFQSGLDSVFGPRERADRSYSDSQRIVERPQRVDNLEVALFNGAGKAHAYIAVNDELTIYLYEGKPVAYLQKNNDGGHHVYGFNGKHLGWLVKGVIRDRDGNASCATKEALRTTEYEPYKAYKQYKPYKSYAEYAPYQPYFSNSFGNTTCQLLLSKGTD